MINWQRTKELFGYSSSTDLISKRPKVICVCDTCGKERQITVRVKSRIVDNQLPWLCPSCVGHRRSTELSAQLKTQWATEEYRQRRSQTSLSLWESEEYKQLHSKQVKKAMAIVDMSAILHRRYSDPAEREKIRAASLLAWSDEERRAKHLRTMRSDEVRAIIGAKARARWLDADYRNMMATIRTEQIGKISKIQTMLYELLDSLDIEYHKEGPDTKFGYYVFDCHLPQHKILIECHGDYWHSLAKAQMRDKQKFTYISRYYPNYKVVYFWEREFYEQDRVISRLRSLCGIDQKIIDFEFSDVVVRPIDSAKHFLELYHYIGPGRGGTKIGAFIGDLLIAVAVFGHPVRQNLQFNSQALECSRFCIHASYHKKNFASWFLTRCVRLLPRVTLFAYSDCTVGHAGTIYKAAGWKHDHDVPADYWYTDVDGFVMHKKTLYNRAINLKMTESDFAEKYGFQKIIGGPKQCFVKST